MDNNFSIGEIEIGSTPFHQQYANHFGTKPIAPNGSFEPIATTESRPSARHPRTCSYVQSLSYHEATEPPMQLLTSCFSPTDHILRSTNNSSSIRSRRTRNSSVVTNPWDKEEATIRGGGTRTRSGKHSKYSPTPSIKRGKAERLLKEHGSPPGIRVTAGGLIVPDGLSPLTSPRLDPGTQSKLSQERPNTYAVPSALSLRP